MPISPSHAELNMELGNGTGGAGGGGSGDDEVLSTWDDATWILTSTFIIFTMQSGFGLLESGSVSKKNEANIMIKNCVDVVFGSLSYWMFGYGLSFGYPSFYGLFGTDSFFLTSRNSETMGYKYSHFFFQSSFATTATTIVSGSMAERANFNGYIIFSFFNTFLYALPAHWIWHEDGFLNKFGAIDYAGSGAVHLVGGVTALVATIMIGPRVGRFHPETAAQFEQMGNPINTILGMFMLWWGWLGFNCGSTYGVAGGKWKLAAKSAVTTINGSISAGAVAFIISIIVKKRKYDIGYLINGILGGLVSITSICAAVTPGEALIIGAVGSVITLGVFESLPRVFKIDDPVGAVAVHGAAGVWSLLAVGLFANKDLTEEQIVTKDGLFNGGDFSLMISQLAYIACLFVWTIVTTSILLKLIDLGIGIRGELAIEVFGADLIEHNIKGHLDHKTRELFDSKNNFVGVLSKDLSLDEMRVLHAKFLLTTMDDHHREAMEFLLEEFEAKTAREMMRPSQRKRGIRTMDAPKSLRRLSQTVINIKKLSLEHQKVENGKGPHAANGTANSHNHTNGSVSPTGKIDHHKYANEYADLNGNAYSTPYSNGLPSPTFLANGKPAPCLEAPAERRASLTDGSSSTRNVVTSL